MIKMVYEENCGHRELNSDTRRLGCSSYLLSRLSNPLEVGSVYELSFWVYFPIDSIVEESILQNIGFLPLLHPVELSANNMLDINRFFYETIPQGQWFQIKKYIRALCPLEYVVLGAFRNSLFPVLHRPYNDHYPFYFIDDVVVEKIKEDTLDTKIFPTPFCKFYEDEKIRLEVGLQKNVSIEFDTDSFNISDDEKVTIDSFISAVDQRWKPVYSIVGHTDDRGDKNASLSLDRAMAIKSYLQEKYEIPNYRMVVFGGGSSFPIKSNETARGRSENRRGTLTVTSLSKEMGLYRQCLELTESGNYEEAISLLIKWVSASDYYNVIYALFDYRLDILKSQKAWHRVNAAVQNKYDKFYASADAFLLDSLRCEDQWYRTLELSIVNLPGYFQQYENFNFDHYRIPMDSLKVYDNRIIAALTDYLDHNEFPTISQIGRRNVEGLIFIMIHSGDTNLIKQYLPVIREMCLEGEAEWPTWAMLSDRLCVLQNMPQQYGMQSVFIDDERTQLQLYRLDSLEMVNERRKFIGLSPIVDPERITYLKMN